MEVIIQKDPQAASHLAARRIAALIRRKPDAVLGMATGNTPLALYAELIRMHREEGLDFAHITTFNLDEYVGLEPTHACSYSYFMWSKLFSHINIRPERVFIPSGQVEGEKIDAYCDEYEADMHRVGGLDLQILGIGSDGHIGFNEPGSSLTSRTRIKTLTPRTRQDNAPFFSSLEEVPHHVLTMGVGTIMEAREICLLAFGTNKANALADAVEGPITASVPASILQMHRTAKVYTDEAAAANLARGEYYRNVYANKPAWQLT